MGLVDKIKGLVGQAKEKAAPVVDKAKGESDGEPAESPKGESVEPPKGEGGEPAEQPDNSDKTGTS